MNWEWVVLACVVVACLTLVIHARMITEAAISDRVNREVAIKINQVLDEVMFLRTEVEGIKTKSSTMEKLADDTRKLLSQANLSTALGVIGKRG